MKVYVTKYLFTEGIIEVEGESRDSADGMIWAGYFQGNEWHPTREDAIKHALTMIATKRKSIAKQLAAIEELEKSLLEYAK